MRYCLDLQGRVPGTLFTYLKFYIELLIVADWGDKRNKERKTCSWVNTLSLGYCWWMWPSSPEVVVLMEDLSLILVPEAARWVRRPWSYSKEYILIVLIPSIATVLVQSICYSTNCYSFLLMQMYWIFSRDIISLPFSCDEALSLACCWRLFWGMTQLWHLTLAYVWQFLYCILSSLEAC